MTHTDPDNNLRDSIRERILEWYDAERRPLPWRTEPSIYGTVVSEFMLQQTQVATVVPYFEQFLREFPDFESLAAADEQDVLRAWSGLGYYRRARMLKRLAEMVVRRHGGRLPRDLDELGALPGMGPYTLGAVGSIALGLATPLVDGNVRRVIARLFALDGDLVRGPGKKRVWSVCEYLVDPARPGDFNQGLMELGATVCVPREPLCLICPVFGVCRARVTGFPENYPAPVRRPARKRVREVAVALMRGEKILILQRGEEASFAGMWELPRLDSRQALNDDELTPAHVLFELVRIRIGEARLIGQSHSTFTHHLICTELYRVEDDGTHPVRRQRHVAHKWTPLRRLANLPASRAQTRLFECVAEHTG